MKLGGFKTNETTYKMFNKTLALTKNSAFYNK